MITKQVYPCQSFSTDFCCHFRAGKKTTSALVPIFNAPEITMLHKSPWNLNNEN